MTAILALVVAGIMLPWRPPGLRGAVQRSLSDRLGYDVRIGGLSVWPAGGVVKIRDLCVNCSSTTFSSPVSRSQPKQWDLSRATLRLNLFRLVFGDDPVDVDVLVEDCDPLSVYIRQSDVYWSPPFDRLAAYRPSGAKPGRWRLASLKLGEAALSVLLPPTKRRPVRRVDVSVFRAEYESDPNVAFQAVSVTGQAGVTREAAFRARLIHRSDKWKLRIWTDAFEFDLPNVDPDLRNGAVGSALITGMIDRTRPEGWDFLLSARSSQVRFSDVVETGTSATLTGRFDASTSRAAAVLELGSRDSRIGALIDLRIDTAADSMSTLTVERLSEGWYRLWNRRRFRHYPAVEGKDARFTIAGAARVLGHSPWIENPHARVVMEGAGLKADYLPLDVYDVRLDTEFWPERIALHDCSGRWAGGWARFGGRHEGLWFGRVTGTADVDWSFGLRAEDLITTLPAAAEEAMTARARTAYEKRPYVEGDVEGSGTLRLEWGEPREYAPPTTRTLRGVVKLAGGRIDHPRLPDAVTDIDATFQLSPDRLEINRVSGKFLETTATVNATIEGSPYFWNQPTVRCEVDTQFPISRAVEYIPEVFRERAESVNPSGVVFASLALSGPWRRPLREDDIAATGVFLVENGAFDSTFYGLAGRFDDLTLRAVLDRHVVKLTTATGRIEGVPFTLAGEADVRAGRLWTRLESSAPFTAYKKVLPRALSRFEVGGDLSGWLRLEASGDELFKNAVQIRELTSETLAKLPFEWHLTGEILARDAVLTFETFPTSITQINGRLQLDDLDWTFVDMTSSWGKTKNCAVTGKGRFRPGNWPELHIDLEAPVLYLDEWVCRWRRSRGSRFPSRIQNPVFDLTGTVRGKRAFYRGHPGEDFYGEISLVAPRGKVNVFRYKNARTDLYGGRLLGEGGIATRQGLSTTTLQFTAKNLSLSPLLQTESGREQTFVGQMSGDATFRWSGGDVETLAGDGRIEIRESRFFGNVFFRNLASLIKIPYLDEVSFARIEAPIRVLGRKVFCDRLSMEGTLMSMNGKGTVGFDRSLDFYLELGFSRLPKYARLVDLIVQSFGKVPSTVFSLDLRGTWDNPQYSFHQLGVAEKGLLNAIEQVWGVLAPKSPGSSRPDAKDNLPRAPRKPGP